LNVWSEHQGPESTKPFSPSGTRLHHFPNGGTFAFTVVDDTDFSTVENVGSVYDFLLDQDILTCKTVWPLSGPGKPERHGTSLEEPRYRRFAQGLQRRGVELALHNVQHGSAHRARTMQGLAAFAEHFGCMPRVHCNHETSHENLYWGTHRFRNGIRRYIYAATTLLERTARESTGQVDGSEYFWGDLCQQHISYVRNFVFREINLDRINPSMPYHETSKPWVNAWFSASDGEDVVRFCRLISEENQDRLEAEGGVCVVYTHFAYGFFDRGQIHPQFERLVRRLRAKKGWFVPVSLLMDHLRTEHQSVHISDAEVAAMERRWLADRIRQKISEATRVNAHPWDRFRKIGNDAGFSPEHPASVPIVQPVARAFSPVKDGLPEPED